MVRQKRQDCFDVLLFEWPETIVFNILSRERRSDMATTKVTGRSLRILVLWILINTGKFSEVYIFISHIHITCNIKFNRFERNAKHYLFLVFYFNEIKNYEPWRLMFAYIGYTFVCLWILLNFLISIDRVK